MRILDRNIDSNERPFSFLISPLVGFLIAIRSKTLQTIMNGIDSINNDSIRNKDNFEWCHLFAVAKEENSINLRAAMQNIFLDFSLFDCLEKMKVSLSLSLFLFFSLH